MTCGTILLFFFWSIKTSSRSSKIPLKRSIHLPQMISNHKINKNQERKINQSARQLNKSAIFQMSMKCSQHKYNECEFVYLKPNAKNILLCSDCVDESKGDIKMNDCVAIKSALLSDNKTILSKFPPLGNPSFMQLIVRLCSSIDSEKKQIKEFYQKLVNNYEKAINRAMIKSKTEINKLEQLQQGFIEQYQKIAQTQRLKELLLQQKDSNQDNKLRSFLVEKIEQSSSNSNFIEAQIKQLQLYRDNFSTQPAEIITTRIEEDINRISFFNLQEQINPCVSLALNQSNLSNKKSIIKKIQIVPSKNIEFFSTELEIKRTDNSQILILCSGTRGQSFIENKLNPDKRYIITIKNTNENTSKNQPFFLFGIMPYSLKYDRRLGDFELCYSETKNYYGISQMLKGEKLHLGEDYGTNMENYWRVHDNRRFEIRICLKEKLLRVGSLPNYELVAELSNKGCLDLSEEYIFAVEITGRMSTILLEDVCEVESFNDLM